MNDIIIAEVKHLFENVACEQCLYGQLSGPPEPLGDLELLRYQHASSERVSDVEIPHHHPHEYYIWCLQECPERDQCSSIGP